MTNLEMVTNQVNNAIRLYESKNIPALQQQLYELYSNFNKQGGGALIINYPEKELLADCFTLMLRYDWANDSDIREVWAENGFFCLIEYINRVNIDEDKLIGGFSLFHHLFFGEKNLIPKINDILIKAQIRNELVFSVDDYNNGAEYVINQFMFLSAQIMKPLVDKYDSILTNGVKKSFINILKDRTCCNLSSEEIFAKAKFISKIIGYLIENSN